MPTVAVLPVKPFRLGKGRLADSLSVDTRVALGEAFALHTADLAAAAGMIPLIVAGDLEVAEWALVRGIPTVEDPGDDLSAAATAGVEWAQAAGSRWLVLHCDLPLLDVSELVDLEHALEEHRTAIAPSADGGTSALGGIEPIPFAYGPGSFYRHLVRAPDAMVVARAGLLHDVDSPADLLSARNHPRGAWLGAVLG